MMRSSPPTSSVATASPPPPPPSSSPPQPGIPAAAAPLKAAALRKSRRERSRLSQFMWYLLSRASPECAARKTLDEAVEEDVVEEGDRDAGDERGGKQPLPEEDVAADELGRHADGDRLRVRARDEGERVDELVEGEREREDDDGEDPRDRDREDDPPERPQSGGAVHLGGILELPRDRLEEAHQEPGGEGDREGGVDEHERDQGVLEAELGDPAREGEEEERRRDEVGEEDADAEALSPAPRQAGQRIPRRHRERERDRHDHEPHERRVEEPAAVLGLREEEVDVREGGRVVEDERVVVLVVEVAVRLERRDQHQVEGIGEHDRERPHHEVGAELLARAAAHLRHLGPAGEPEHQDRDGEGGG